METNQLQDKAQEWQGEAQEAAQNLPSKVEQKASDFKQTAQEWRKRAAKASRKTAQAIDDYTHENPWRLIASVAVVSLLAGFLLGRTRNPDF